MIFDKVQNAKIYKGISKNLDKALDVLMTENFAAKENGKHIVDGDNVYYLIMKPETRPLDKCIFESHEKYIDIQCVLKGVENIGYAETSDLKITQAYDGDNDAALYAVPKKYTNLLVEKGCFAIFFPKDGHMPLNCVGKPAIVEKVVIKVKV